MAVRYLEYIESAGTQCINTKFKPNQNTDIEIKVKTEQSGSFVFAGCDTPDSTDDKGQNNNGEQQNIQNDSFEYSAGEKAVLTVLSTDNLSKRYKDWDMNPAEYSTDEARIQELINIIDRQTWAPLSSGNISVMQQDASLKLDRTLISEKDNGTPCDVGENADIVYFFDLEQGTALMVYEVFNTDMWDRCCTLNEEDLNAVIEIFYYYRSMHIE